MFFNSFYLGNDDATYPDGTALMQLCNPDNFDNLYIRLLHPNGTLTKLTFYDTGSYIMQYAYPLNDGYALIIQIKDSANHVYGKLVDWSGQELQRDVILADIPITFNLTPIATANVNPNKGFLVATAGENVVLWKVFSAPNSSRQITQLYEGILTGNDDKILQDYVVFPTTEGGYGMALLKRVSTFTQDPLISKVFHSSPQWFLYVTFWQPDTTQFDTPHLVWQNTNILSPLFIIGCEVAVSGTGYFCIIRVPSTTLYDFDYVRVAFLSSGSVTDVNAILEEPPHGLTGVSAIRQLPYGGFVSFIPSITATTTGLLRLTPEGTTLFEHLSTDDKNAFFDSMVAKLAELVPIDPSRITTNKHNQPDPNAPAHQILFSVTLKSSDDMSQRTVQQIIDDFDELIKNKAYNSFSREYLTSYLDEAFGFLPAANLWDAYKFKFIGVLISLLVLLIICFFARQKYPEGQSFVVIKFALILADLSLDIAFVLSSAKNVPQIHIPRYYSFGL
ncbi:9596_t:CDS:2 [Paraglomus brasilianum]|uniref:9596_t:CDS:1 n=1 Tax=Paraglomus brasilianum TaxID=144538 RepID=A0A9N9GNE8_9GLOM|nr:9596_t:CDS:2 [Paraglomus brasilianum]